MTDNVLPFAMVFAGGALLGLLYFVGLWQTVRYLGTLRSPHLWLLLSWALRLTVLLLGVYWLGAGDWRRLIAAMAGIMVARAVLARRIGRIDASWSGPVVSVPGKEP